MNKQIKSQCILMGLLLLVTPTLAQDGLTRTVPIDAGEGIGSQPDYLITIAGFVLVSIALALVLVVETLQRKRLVIEFTNGINTVVDRFGATLGEAFKIAPDPVVDVGRTFESVTDYAESLSRLYFGDDSHITQFLDAIEGAVDRVVGTGHREPDDELR